MNTLAILTAYDSSTDGSLQIVTSPGDGYGIPDNRTGYQMGNVVILSFEIGHVGDDSTSYSTPSVMWLEDGTPVGATPTNTPGANGRITTTLSFAFQESDAGVYQCVITGNNSELLATIPIRLDTGQYFVTTIPLKSLSFQVRLALLRGCLPPPSLSYVLLINWYWRSGLLDDTILLNGVGIQLHSSVVISQSHFRSF